jgi:predicted permease
VPWLNEDRALWLNLVGRMTPARRAGVEARLHQANRLGAADFVERVFAASDDGNRRHALLAAIRLEDFGGGFSRLRERFADALSVLMLLVGGVLLVACANIAGLLLVRGAARRRDLAIRAALGATRARLAASAVVETLSLALAGGIAGSITGYWASLALARIALGLTDEPLPAAFALDPVIVAFAVAVSLITALLCSVLPAIRAARPGGAGELANRSSPGAQVLGGTRPLVAVQLALAIVVIVTSGLLLRTLVNLMTIEPGFNRSGLLSVAFDAPASGYTGDQLAPMYERVRAALTAIPGVRAASFSTCGLIAGCQNAGGFVIDGYQPRLGEKISIQESRVGPHYVATTGMVLAEGRDISERDRADAPRVAVVNEAMVHRYFGGRSPIGRRLGYGQPDVTIVGVVRDARLTALQSVPRPVVFMPLAQGDFVARNVAVEVTGDPQALVTRVRETLAKAEPQLVIAGITPIGDLVKRNVSRERLVAYVASMFAAVALLLSCVGLYSVLSYGVTVTLHGLGVRLALGATPAQLSRLVVADGSRMVGGGITLGLAAVIPAGRLLGPMLFDIMATDVTTIAASVAVLAAVTLTASYLPARRAMRVDPVTALRAE